MVMRRKKGFTPIELLVVIAIIALLTSIVTPAMKKAKQQARAVVCTSNLRQWGMVFNSYFEDNDSKFADYAQRRAWVEIFRDYYDNPNLRVCPSAKKMKNPKMDPTMPNSHIGGASVSWGMMPKDLVINERTIYRRGDFGSYGMSQWASMFTGKNSDPDKDKYWNRITQVRSRASVPLFVDCSQRTFKPREDDVPPIDSDGTGGGKLARACLDRHNKAVNALFMDFSASDIKLKQLWKLQWHRGWVPQRPVWTPWMRELPE